MSYDLRVWGRQTADLGSCLPVSQGWVQRGDTWTLEKRSWQIVVHGVQPAEPEDAPPEANELLPGLCALVEVSLEPLSAPRAAHTTLSTTARTVATMLSGLVEDPQEGTFTLARGVKRYARPKRSERLTLLELSWWYDASPLRAEGGPGQFLQVLRSALPEAVPRRYGLNEPPQHRTEETGLAHLADFVAHYLGDSAVFYPTRPVVGFTLADCNTTPHPRFGFRSNHFALQVEAAALEQPGWDRAVRRLWREVSRFLRPFYGDVRVMRGYTWAGATLGIDRETDVHPVCSWWWQGIPPRPPMALVLGPPYTELWQPEPTHCDGDLVFVEPPRWSTLEPLALEVPPDIAQPWEPEGNGNIVPWRDAYPPRWPFGEREPSWDRLTV